MLLPPPPPPTRKWAKQWNSFNFMMWRARIVWACNVYELIQYIYVHVFAAGKNARMVGFPWQFYKSLRAKNKGRLTETWRLYPELGTKSLFRYSLPLFVICYLLFVICYTIFVMHYSLLKIMFWKATMYRVTAWFCAINVLVTRYNPTETVTNGNNVNIKLHLRCNK